MTELLAEAIAAEVRAEMGRRRVRARELANLLGISQTQMSRRLSGRVQIRPNELQKIATYLEVPLTQLLRVA